MAAMLDRINRERDVHIVTVEDPLEYLFQHQKALVNQRGRERYAFLPGRPEVRAAAGPGRRAHRGDAGSRDHPGGADDRGDRAPTFATLHTNSCAQSIDRIIDVFPPTSSPRSGPSWRWCWRRSSTSLVPRRDGRAARSPWRS